MDVAFGLHVAFGNLNNNMGVVHVRNGGVQRSTRCHRENLCHTINGISICNPNIWSLSPNVGTQEVDVCGCVDLGIHHGVCQGTMYWGIRGITPQRCHGNVVSLELGVLRTPLPIVHLELCMYFG